MLRCLSAARASKDDGQNVGRRPRMSGVPDMRFDVRKSAKADLRWLGNCAASHLRVTDQGLRSHQNHASSLLNTTEALVPPKPNELESTWPSLASSRRSRTMFMSLIAGSRFSMLALAQMKPFCIISSE